VVALALAAIGSGATSAVASAPPPRPISPPPANVLLVLVDDQAMNTFTPRLMPKRYRWIVRPGTKFTAGLAAPPLCCPDHAGILTGDYPHDSGVFSNSPGYASLTDNGDTLPVWLRAAGYRTGLVGHFLNGYESAAGA
jgi:N-acetylglucosamine-6-sulfatase